MNEATKVEFQVGQVWKTSRGPSLWQVIGVNQNTGQATLRIAGGKRCQFQTIPPLKWSLLGER